MHEERKCAGCGNTFHVGDVDECMECDKEFCVTCLREHVANGHDK
jgi:hypothetical protein